VGFGSFSLLDTDDSACDVSFVEVLYGLLSVFVAFESDEAEASGLFGVGVIYNPSLLQSSVLAEELLQVLLLGLVRQVRHVQVVPRIDLFLTSLTPPRPGRP
jgi:hypothetical protein